MKSGNLFKGTNISYAKANNVGSQTVKARDIQVRGRNKERLLDTNNLEIISQELKVRKGGQSPPTILMEELQGGATGSVYGCVGDA